MKTALGEAVPSASAISLDGGLARSRYLVSFLTDILERPVAVRGKTDLTALGAGWLALAATDGVRLADPIPELDRDPSRPFHTPS